jgi:outer membrane protein assembly factor BamB
MQIPISCLLLFPVALQAQDWPWFRGPSRQGTSTEKGISTRWSETENIAWKTAIPGEGWSSPIVYGGRVFLTTASEDGAAGRVISVDRDSGKILWNREVLRQETPRKENKNSYATPTPATDGKRVYAVFGAGGIAAVDFQSGETVWTYRDVHHYSQHGLGASPVLYNDLLIMPFDGSSDGEDKKVGWQKPWERSFILALDTATGKERWRAKRGLSRIAHVTPNIVREGSRDILVSGAGDVVQGFDLKTGERLWTARNQGEGVVPSVVAGDGMVYTSSGFEKPTIRATRWGGRDSVTDTHIVWEQTRGVPRIPSFVYIRPHLYTITEQGIAMCLDGKTGEILWQERIGGNHSASPVHAGGHVYFTSEEGETTVIKAAPKFEVVATNRVDGGMVQASMAISRGQIFLRTADSLYCIGKAR